MAGGIGDQLTTHELRTVDVGTSLGVPSEVSGDLASDVRRFLVITLVDDPVHRTPSSVADRDCYAR
jgi:hypothetical protein